MKNVEKHLVGWLSVCLLLCSYPVWAQGDAGDYLTIVGMVKDNGDKGLSAGNPRNDPG